MISTSAAIMNSSNSFIPMADYDLLNENGTVKNLQGISFNFYYERAPGFAESTLIIPLILIFIGRLKSKNPRSKEQLSFEWSLFNTTGNR